MDRETGQFNFDIKHRAGKKIPHADCLSHKNTGDDEQTAFLNAIAMDAEQDNTNYDSRGWQLDKLQKIKLRDSQQKWQSTQRCIPVGTKQKWPEPRQMKNGASKELWKYCGSIYKSLSHRRDFVS